MKVLIIEDSALMRRELRKIVGTLPGVDIQTARNGQDGLDVIESFDPDVVTLDINMPVMDGLTCLSHIMTRFPRPVVMVSSLTEKGALATFEALEMGAVDYIPKPDGTVSLNANTMARELLSKIQAAARARVPGRGAVDRRPPAPSRPPLPRAGARLTDQAPRAGAAMGARRSALAPASTPPLRPVGGGTGTAEGLVVMGASTGGPSALEQVLRDLPATLPWPVLIAQHMPAQFTGTFARRLNSVCPLSVLEVDRPQVVEPGQVFIGRGGSDIVVGRRAGRLVVLSMPPDQTAPWHPCVDRLVTTAMEHVDPAALIGVLMTGMGDDGARAMTELYRRGGRTIAESEETAVVFGMPGELVAMGGAAEILPLARIGRSVSSWCQRKAAAP